MNKLFSLILISLVVSLVVTAFGISTAYAITPAEQKNLQKLLECRSSVNYKMLHATMKRENISVGGDIHILKSPIRIFGLPTKKISLFMESGENIYQSHMDGYSERDLIRAAKLIKDSGEYGRQASGGYLTLYTYETVSFRCTISFDNYDE